MFIYLPSENTKPINLVVFFPFFSCPHLLCFGFFLTINCGCNKCLLSAHLETFGSLVVLVVFEAFLGYYLLHFQ